MHMDLLIIIKVDEKLSYKPLPENNGQGKF